MALRPQTPGTPAGVLDLWRGVVDHRRLVSQIFGSSSTEEERYTSDEETDGQEEELRTLIHCAASQDNEPCVAILLARGVSCDLQDRYGRTALHWAAEQGSTSVVRTLGRFGASLDALSHHHNTPLMLAAERGHEDIVRMLLHARAGATDRHEMGGLHMGWLRNTALHSAAKGGHAGVVSILLGNGFHAQQRNESGFTAAEVSARQRQPSSSRVTQLLLPVQDGGGQMVFDRVNRVLEDAEIVHGLVRGGAFVNWQDPNMGETPLHRAVYFGHNETLKILLRAGADPSLRDHVGGSPLHMAAVAGATAAAEALLRAGAEKEAYMMDSYCPLHLAVGNGNTGVVGMLLRASVSIDQPDLNHGASALSWAARLGRTPILHALLEAGANVNARCASAGLTCLHWACRMTRADSVDALLQGGADLDAVDDTGRNACSMIGLGDPTGIEVENGEECQRLLDPGSTGRIRRALVVAKRDRAWCRRGWLVVLATRRGLMGTKLVVNNRWKNDRAEVAAGASARAYPAVAAMMATTMTGMSHRGSRRAVSQKRSRRQKRAREDPPGASSIHPDPLTARHGDVIPPTTHVHKEIDGINDIAVQLDPTSVHGVDLVEENATPLPPGKGTVEALLRVAAVEMGVFRNVVSFI